MARDLTFRRRTIIGCIVFLVLADVALAAYSWELASAPGTPQQQLSAETKQHDLLKAGVKRAQDIRDKIPAIQKDCGQFEASLFPASTGYSSVTSELGGLARNAGTELEAMGFKQTEIVSRGLTEVAIDATVSGNYKSVIHFLNSVQRSRNHYAVDGLSLGAENSNQAASGIVKIALHLKTYFRTGA